MSQLTRCPNCATLFRVSDAQLALRGGRVRCGNCSFVFNARACFVDADPVTIIDLSQQHGDPFAIDDLPSPAVVAQAEVAAHPRPAPISFPAIEAHDQENDKTTSALLADLQEMPPPAWLKQASESPEPENTAALAEPPPPAPAPSVSLLRNEPEDITEEIIVAPSQDWLKAAGPSPWRWFWRFCCLLLLALAFASSALLLRQPLLEWYPPSRPLLAAACAKLQCKLHAPQNPAYLFLDGIEFSFDPENKARLELSGVLRNTAPYSQAWPLLDVQLLDLQSQRVARRILKPEQYLTAAEKQSDELPAEQEILFSVFLYLDPSIHVENYKVEVLYPSAK